MSENNVIDMFPEKDEGVTKYLAVCKEMYETRKAALELGLKIEQRAQFYNAKFTTETADMQVEGQKLQAKVDGLLKEMVDLELESAGLPRKNIEPKKEA